MPRFTSIFRTELARKVEFSFSAHPDTYGTLTSGSGREFWSRVRHFAADQRYAGAWLLAADGVIASLQTPDFFFKVDWVDNRAVRITIYLRCTEAAEVADLTSALAHAYPLQWSGPDPLMLARHLGEQAPFIISLRTGIDGHQVAMYYRMRSSRDQVIGHQLPAVTTALALPDSTPGIVSATMAGLPGCGAPSIIGVTSPTRDKPIELKLDVCGVPLADALRWIGRHRASPHRTATIAETARRLRIPILNYCGAKVGANGMLGWKVYLPVHPNDRVAAVPRVHVDSDQVRLTMAPW